HAVRCCRTVLLLGGLNQDVGLLHCILHGVLLLLESILLLQREQPRRISVGLCRRPSRQECQRRGDKPRSDKLPACRQPSTGTSWQLVPTKLPTHSGIRQHVSLLSFLVGGRYRLYFLSFRKGIAGVDNHGFITGETLDDFHFRAVITTAHHFAIVHPILLV